MKIAYIFLNNLENKTADVCQSLSFASEFSKKNKLVFFSSYFKNNKIIENLSFFSIEKNFKIIRAPFSVQREFFLLEKVNRFFSCFFILLYLKFSKFDLIYTRDFSFIYFLSFVPGFFKPKVKVFFESHKIYSITSKKVNERQEFRAYKEVSFFISTSTNCKKDLLSIFEIESNKVKTLPNAVDLGFFKDKKYFNKKDLEIFFENKEESDKLLVVYSGSFLRWKGVDVLINSFKYLNDTVKVVLLGGDINDLKCFKEELDFYIKKKKLLVMDSMEREEMRTVLQNSDIGLLSNNFDNNNEYTSPMKIPEYMASGLAIIAPDVLKSCDFLDDGLGVLFFKTSNSRDLASKINFIQRNRGEMERMSIENFKKSNNFSLENRVDKILDFFLSNYKTT